MADIEIGTFTPEQTRELWQWYQRSKQLSPQLQQNFPQRRQIDEPSPHRIFVKNESGEEIPAYGCMQITGAVTEAGRVFLKVTKPNTICGECIFNSQFKIAVGAYGWGYAFGIVRMLGSAGAYSSCERYGATAGSWSISQNDGGFLVYGDDGEKPGVVIGRIVGDHCKARWIKFTYEVGGGSNSTPTVTDYWDGQNPATCGTVNVEYPLGEPCTDSTVVAFYNPNTGTYQAIATPNAMQGVPVTKVVIIDDGFGFEGCTLNYKKQSTKVITCDVDPEDDSTLIETEAVQVMVDLTYGDNVEIKHFKEVYVCGFSAETTEDIPGAVCCYGTTDWVWNYALQEWTQVVSTCSEGCVPVEPDLPVDFDDPSSNGTTATTDCAEAP